MKKYLIIGAVIVGLIIIGFFVFRGTPEYAKPTAGENIIFFGDSLVAGVGAAERHDIVSQLSEITGLDIINAGLSGDTTVSALARIQADVLARKPKVVIVLLGGNDFLQRVPAEETNSAIRGIVERILQTGSGVILINENKNTASVSVFSKLAKEKHIPYIENLLGDVSRDKKLMSDTIHPNSDGYAAMAQKIKPVLENYLK